MEPGRNCLECHGPDPASEKGPLFGAAGTVYPSVASGAGAGIGGAIVRVTDANRKVFTMYSNGAGNFFWRGEMALPLQHVEIERDGQRSIMQAPPVSGACNACHAPGASTAGRVHVP